MVARRFEDHPDVFVDEIGKALLSAKIRKMITVQDNGCHYFSGTKSQSGYGLVYAANGRWFAHRVMKYLADGPIDPNMSVDHLCGNKACVNPQHLEVVTQRENVQRALMFKDVCAAGHSMADAYVRPDGRRVCKLCHEARRLRRLADPARNEDLMRRNREQTRSYRERKRLLG